MIWQFLRAAIFAGVVFMVFASEGLLLVSLIRTKIRGRKLSTSFFFRKYAYPVHFAAIIGSLCIAYGYLIEPYQLEVTNLQIRTAELAAENFRLVHISDLHCDPGGRNEQQLIETINNLDADAVLYTGDSMNSSAALPVFQKTMKAIKAPVKLGVYGNWDQHFRNLNIFAGTGFQRLKADIVKLRKGSESINICGLDSATPGRHEKLLAGLDANDYCIMLFHYPYLVEQVKGDKVDLYLCGHTHGGQIALPFYGAIITLGKYSKKYERGAYYLGPTMMYVNRGIGCDGGPVPRVRFLSKPEVTVFDIAPLETRK